MKRIDITPINYRWHRLTPDRDYRNEKFMTGDELFQIQEDCLMKTDDGFDSELGFDLYSGGKIRSL